MATQTRVNPLPAPGDTERAPPPVWLSLSVLLLAVPLAFLAAYRPFVALLMLGGIALAFVAALRVRVALLLLIASAPLEGAVGFGVAGLSPTKLAGLLCFTSFALYAITSHRSLFLERSHAIVLGLLALALVSSVQAQELGPALETTFRYASFVALYIVVSQFVGDQALQRKVAWVLSAASATAAALAISRFASHESVDATLAHADPNDFGYMMATTLPFAFWLLRERRILWPVVLGMVALISAATALSFSRGALVGLAAGALAHLFTERRHIPALLLGAAVALAAAALFVHSHPTQLETGLELKQKVASANIEARIDAWRGAIDLIAQHPLLGVGPGNFQFHFYEATGRPPGSPALRVVHNAYLDVGAELGLIGMMLLLLYVVQTFLRLSLARRRAHGPPGFAAVVRTSFVVACVSAFFLSEQYFAPFWLLGGLGTALWAEGRLAERDTV